MSQFLSANAVTINGTEYQPNDGVVTIPDAADAIAVNRLGLTKLLPAPSAPEHAEIAQ